MRQNEAIERRRREAFERRNDGRASGLGVWSILGGAAVAVAAVVVIATLPDLKRYIKISRM